MCVNLLMPLSSLL